MTRALPSLEAPPSGSTCDTCGEEIRILGFCASCYDHAMQEHELANLQAELDPMRSRPSVKRRWLQ